MKRYCLILILVMQLAWGGQMYAAGLIEAVNDTAFYIRQKKNLAVEAKMKFGKSSNQYVDALRALVEEYDALRMYDSSLYYSQQIYGIVSKTQYKEQLYAQYLAGEYCLVGNQKNDINQRLNYYYTALKYIAKSNKKDLDVIYLQAAILNNIWMYGGGTTCLPIEKIYPYSENTLLRKAQELCRGAMDVAKNGDKKKAISLEKEAKEEILRVCGSKSLEHAESLTRISSYYYLLSQYKEAIENVEEAINIITHLVLNDRVDCQFRRIYVNYLKSLANYVGALSVYTDKSYIGLNIKIMKEASKIYRTIPNHYTFFYAEILNDLAGAYSTAGKDSMAIQTQKASLSAFDRCNAQKTSSYANALMNLGVFYFKEKDWDSAYDWLSKSLECYRNLYGDNSAKYREALYNMSACCWQKGNVGELNYYTTLTNTLTSDFIKQTFSTLTAEDRSTFWDRYKGWFEISVHKYPYLFPTNSLCCTGYNGVLLSKGLLLHTEMEFAKLIYESGDIELEAMYDGLKSTRQEINKLLEKPISERSTNMDSLKRIVEVKEDVLKELSKVYGNYTKNIVITWEQVQEKLTDKDIAVEFVSFPLNADSTMYIAYALKKDWECPKMIPLFEEKQLLAVQKGDRYTTDSISCLVWEPLDEVMPGVEKVYFAPSGELYNIAIESIPSHEDGGETLVAEHRDFYRLSSTRELALIKDESRWNEAAVYGGLQYGMSVKGMIEEDGKYERAAGQKRGDCTPSYYVVREDSIGRGDRDLAQGLAYLEGTKKEAEAITHDLERKAVDARLFTDSIGTETSFKALGGKKTSIIHIGTHGFFNDRKKEYKDDKLQLLGIDQQTKVIEDDALTRSGLYFAGADNVILNGLSAVPDSIDDGRLTAAEIAQLDLRELDMVVLSACQTGLGEITGDGVFGLQRGFKKAGAQTIVMSLWDVKDRATQDFMTTFFENINVDSEKHPMNKHEAFKKAQNKLRENKDQYPEAPDCWAAFVMLDGVD